MKGMTALVFYSKEGHAYTIRPTPDGRLCFVGEIQAGTFVSDNLITNFDVPDVEAIRDYFDAWLKAQPKVQGNPKVPA